MTTLPQISTQLQTLLTTTTDAIAQDHAFVTRPDRAKAYAQIQDIAARDLPYLPIVETLGYRAWRTSLHNLNYWSGELAESAWLSK